MNIRKINVVSHPCCDNNYNLAHLLGGEMCYKNKNKKSGVDIDLVTEFREKNASKFFREKLSIEKCSVIDMGDSVVISFREYGKLLSEKQQAECLAILAEHGFSGKFETGFDGFLKIRFNIASFFIRHKIMLANLREKIYGNETELANKPPSGLK